MIKEDNGIFTVGPAELKVVEPMRPTETTHNAVRVDRVPTPGSGVTLEESRTKTADPAKPAESTKEAIEKGVEDIRKRLGLFKEKKAAPAKADEKINDPAKEPPKTPNAAPGDAKKGEADKDAGKDPKSLESPPKAQERPSLNEETISAIAEASARAATEAIRGPAREPDKAKPVEDGLTDEEADRYRVFKRMGKDNQKYKSTAQDYVTFLGKQATYAEQWMKQNPGKEFDPEAEEHDQAYKSIEPKYSETDFAKAQARLEAEQEIEARDKKWQERFDKLESEHVEAKMEGQIKTSVASAIDSFAEKVNPDYIKILNEKGLKGLQEHDEIAHDVVKGLMGDIANITREIERLTHPSRKFKYDANNQIHQWLDNFMGTKETDMKAKPIADQIDGGKMFATQSEYARMPADRRGRYWTFDHDAMKKLVVDDLAANARRLIESENGKMQRYMERFNLAKTPPKAEPTDTVARPAASAQKPSAPDGATDPNVGPRNGEQKGPVTPEGKLVFSKLFG